VKDILLITPPFTQLNTPYPATAYLKGFLNTKNISSYQMDLGIEVILKIFTQEYLDVMFSTAFEKNMLRTENLRRIYGLRERYLSTIEIVIKFLQGNHHALARQLSSSDFLPRASRFEQLDDVEWAFGPMGFQDRAKHFASLYLEDLSDFIKACIDENFGFSRYAERLGMSANSFDELHDYLQQDLSFVDQITIEILQQRIAEIQPILLCISVPFPGNLYSAFRCAQYVKSNHPTIKIALGGGFPNTELRSVNDHRVFEYFDYITLDDGELPIEIIHSNIIDPSPENPNHNLYKRCFLLNQGQLLYNNNSLRNDYKQENVGTPDYTDLLLDQYISVIEIANPMHSLWSDGRWNKLTMAHGCYWGKCTFCDVSLSYIKDYEPIKAKEIVDRMETIIAQTGERGFHFVDEAAPPSLMKELAIEILKRNLLVSWWTNIRFEKSFTSSLCTLLKASGCIAVSGGLEVASDRLLDLIKKGVTVSQVAQVCRNFVASEIMVHAYLMYGYPTQTVQETVDSLEMVRQMFEVGILESGFWHQFALTAHSPVGMNPDDFGVQPKYPEVSFANNDIDFTDKTGIDHNQFSYGLRKSLINYMHGMCFDFPLQDWFDFPIPKTTIPNDYILECIESDRPQITKETARVLWIGVRPYREKIQNKSATQLTFYSQIESESIQLDTDKANWLFGLLQKLSVSNIEKITYQDISDSYIKSFEDFTLFWYSKEMDVVKKYGLLSL